MGRRIINGSNCLAYRMIEKPTRRLQRRDSKIGDRENMTRILQVVFAAHDDPMAWMWADSMVPSKLPEPFSCSESTQATIQDGAQRARFPSTRAIRNCWVEMMVSCRHTTPSAKRILCLVTCAMEITPSPHPVYWHTRLCISSILKGSPTRLRCLMPSQRKTAGQ